MTSDADRDDILRLERQRQEALTSGDVDKLEAMMGDDLIHIHGTGHVDGKAEYIDGVRNKYIFHRIERGDLNLRVKGDTAVVVGSISQAVSVKGGDKVNEVEGIATQTWIRDGGSWKQNTCHMHFHTVNGKRLL